MATVTAIYRYPVKGLSAEKMNRVALIPGECLPHDRRFAIETVAARQGQTPPGPERHRTSLRCMAARAVCVSSQISLIARDRLSIAVRSLSIRISCPEIDRLRPLQAGSDPEEYRTGAFWSDERTVRPGNRERNRKFADSPLEKAGFEPSVPLTKEWNPGGTVEMMPQFDAPGMRGSACP